MNSNSSLYSDDLDDWFNDLDEKSVEIVNTGTNYQEQSCSDSIEQIYEATNTRDICETKVICVEDILKKNPVELSSYELIQYECTVSYFVQVLMEGSNKIKLKADTIQTQIDSDDYSIDKIKGIIEYLIWIKNACETLANRINQNILIYHPQLKPTIVRSSYNFCTKCTQCKNFYNKYESPTCREHHYVHSLLKYDIESVICFLNYIVSNGIEMTKEEINNLYLSIKTICFVTRHMAKEISYIDYITKKNSESFHRNNPLDHGKKASRAIAHYNIAKSDTMRSVTKRTKRRTVSKRSNNISSSGNRYALLSNN